MKKICHIITSLNQGGAEEMLYKLLEHGHRKKFENIVVSLQTKGVYGDQIEALGIPVYALSMTGILSFFKGVSIYSKIIKKHKPDIIQCWMYHAIFFGMLFKIFSLKAKLLFNIRASLDGLQYENSLLKILIKMGSYFSNTSDRIIYNSFYAAKQHEQMGWCSDKTVVIPNGFNLKIFKASKKIYDQFRQDRRLDADTKIVGMIARHHPIKNQEGFLKVIEILSKNDLKDVVFLLIGKGCRDLGRTDIRTHVLYMENRPTSEVLPAFDVFVLPSWGESFPNVVGEAMACGIPCVVTDVGDCQKIVGSLGAVVKPGDYEKMAEQILKYLNFSHAQKKEYIQKSEKHLKENYDLPMIVEKYESLYQETLK